MDKPANNNEYLMLNIVIILAIFLKKNIMIYETYIFELQNGEQHEN